MIECSIYKEYVAEINRIKEIIFHLQLGILTAINRTSKQKESVNRLFQ